MVVEEASSFASSTSSRDTFGILPGQKNSLETTSALIIIFFASAWFTKTPIHKNGSVFSVVVVVAIIGVVAVGGVGDGDGGDGGVAPAVVHLFNAHDSNWLRGGWVKRSVILILPEKFCASDARTNDRGLQQEKLLPRRGERRRRAKEKAKAKSK